MSPPAGEPDAALPQRQPKAKRKRAEAPSADAAPSLAAGSRSEQQPAEPPAAAAAAGAAEVNGGVHRAAGCAEQPSAEALVPGEPEDPSNPPALHLKAYRSDAEAGQTFEYLDHTADVQLHAWGKTLSEAFESVGLCMFNYMTPLEGIDPEAGPAGQRLYEAEGHDLQSLLYHWLDELLFGFATDFFVPKTLRITLFDRQKWRIEAEGRGEQFDRQRHACGTEIKAITYSAMQINESAGDAEVFVIVDI